MRVISLKRCLPSRFDTLFTIIMRDDLKALSVCLGLYQELFQLIKVYINIQSIRLGIVLTHRLVENRTGPKGVTLTQLLWDRFGSWCNTSITKHNISLEVVLNHVFSYLLEIRMKIACYGATHVIIEILSGLTAISSSSLSSKLMSLLKIKISWLCSKLSMLSIESAGLGSRNSWNDDSDLIGQWRWLHGNKQRCFTNY